MDKDKEVAVAFISDDNYAVNTAVAITSLLKNKRNDRQYSIYFISNGVKAEKLEKIRRLEADNFKIRIVPYEFDGTEFEKKDFNVSPSAIIKFSLADILGNLDKVLYLDGDLVVQRDLGELFDIQIEGKYAAVVRDIVQEKSIPGILEKLKCDLKYYFNSGMMLMNLKKIREENIRDQLFEYKRKGINYFMDQDAFNVVFRGNVVYISCIYNYLITLNESLANEVINREYGIGFWKQEPDRITEAKIIHFAGIDKPWKVRLPYYTDIMMQYYVDSPFSEEKILVPKKKQRQEQYLFPFELVKPGTNIVIWGAGAVGQSYYSQLTYTRYCNVTGWVDKNAGSYEGWGLMNPERLDVTAPDYIVVAIKNEVIAQEVVRELKAMMADERKIIWRYPVLSSNQTCQIGRKQ